MLRALILRLPRGESFYTHCRSFLVLFCIQAILYSLICFNYRAIALSDLTWAVSSDMIIATFNFFVIKQLATSDSEQNQAQFFGYISGSAVGTYIGLSLSHVLLGS